MASMLKLSFKYPWTHEGESPPRCDFVDVDETESADCMANQDIFEAQKITKMVDYLAEALLKWPPNIVPFW